MCIFICTTSIGSTIGCIYYLLWWAIDIAVLGIKGKRPEKFSEQFFHSILHCHRASARLLHAAFLFNVSFVTSYIRNWLLLEHSRYFYVSQLVWSEPYRQMSYWHIHFLMLIVMNESTAVSRFTSFFYRGLTSNMIGISNPINLGCQFHKTLIGKLIRHASHGRAI